MCCYLKGANNQNLFGRQLAVSIFEGKKISDFYTGIKKRPPKAVFLQSFD